MIINLTTHLVTVIKPDGTLVPLVDPFCKVGHAPIDEAEAPGPTRRFVLWQIVDLPEPDGETRYIVSPEVRAVCSDRNDLVVPSCFVWE